MADGPRRGDGDENEHGNHEDREDDDERGVGGERRREIDNHLPARVEAEDGSDVTPRRHTASMVLTAPTPVAHSGATLAPVAPAASVAPERAAERRAAARGAADGGGKGGADEVLALLRGVGTARPRFDPGLAGGLRAWLEDAAWSVTSSQDDDQSPLVLGPRRLLGTPSGSWRLLGRPDGSSDEGQEATHVTRRLVHALFRHLVTTGSITAPLTEAVDALAASGMDDVVDRVRALEPGSRAALEDVLAVHARHLQALVPRFAPSWLPRTDDRIAIPLAGGRVVLRGVFDLLVGTPSRSRASMCALGLSADGPWGRARRTLHYLALLETLRSGCPPFRLATLESASGRYAVDDVCEEQLLSMASHIVEWLVAGVEGDG